MKRKLTKLFAKKRVIIKECKHVDRNKISWKPQEGGWYCNDCNTWLKMAQREGILVRSQMRVYEAEKGELEFHIPVKEAEGFEKEMPISLLMKWIQE